MLGGKLLSKKIEERVEQLIFNTINSLGYNLYDVEYIKEGKDYFLRVYIDKKEGIDLTDCEKVSEAISDMLDKADYIKESYFLEISSPGIERILRKDKHLQENINNKIQIKLFKPIDKKRQVIGILKDFDEAYIKIEIDKNVIEIDRNNISIIKTVFDW